MFCKNTHKILLQITSSQISDVISENMLCTQYVCEKPFTPAVESSSYVCHNMVSNNVVIKYMRMIT